MKKVISRSAVGGQEKLLSVSLSVTAYMAAQPHQAQMISLSLDLYFPKNISPPFGDFIE